MRDIKFRVWDNVDYMSTPFTLQDVQDRKVQFTPECVVMQYIGIKDINGTEIYEGDIIMSQGTDARTTPRPPPVGRPHNKGYKLKIKCVDGQFVAQISKGGKRNRKYPMRSSFIYESSYIVIGNVYQNPELTLKQ